MKRSMILAVALSACLLGGCASPHTQQAPDTGLSAPTQVQAAQPLPVPEERPLPAEPEPSEPVQTPTEPVYEIPSGVWLAGTDLGYSNYYHFDAAQQSGSYVNLDYGLGMSFTYDGAGTELVFSLDDHESPVSATVEHSGEEEFTLIWEDSLPETLTFVGEGSLEDFPFYSNAELAELAGEHYARLTEEEIPSLSGTLTNEDNTVTVQLYDDLGDHNSTAAWYIVDRFTATGTDLLTGEEIDLLADFSETQEIPAGPAEELPGDTAQEVPTEPGAEIPAAEPTQDVPSEETPGDVPEPQPNELS